MNELHIPVLAEEVVAALAVRPGGRYVDGTFGAGGYTRAILTAAPDTMVWGIDRDPAAIERGRALQREFPGRLTLVMGRFGEMDRLAADAAPVDGVALDIGVSSPQIDEAARGFSFRFDGPLDMRMGPDGPTAADLVNTLPEAELADAIYHLGEERYARRVARAIVAARTAAPIGRTLELADIVRRVVPRSRDGIDPATRTFQALRILVNDELGELDRGLAAAERLLAPGGRLAVVSFHSLEDVKVKRFFKTRSGTETGISRHLPEAPVPARAPSFRLITRKPTVPSADEAARNPRARSAKLRVGERTTAPAFPADLGRAAA
ncbi:MAG TPA: 16S rRNA (cytosine(1402)-N(4))-methyltransferase RsmH [Azospirillaceae bacterium]|nr:16S rRNA (cytosine(1402)-N(4))-methyltransferase RsmH [Azospirillaceae bacterium]